MKKNSLPLSYTKPFEGNISREQYLVSVKKMILNSLVMDPTIILHTDEEILAKYDHSIIALNGDQIVGNLSLYSTHMKPLDSVVCPQKGLLRVGELGSVIVDLSYRNHGIGTCLVRKSLDVFSSSYDAVVSATVNDCMAHIFSTFGFESIPFPRAYYDEGRVYLGSKMVGGVEEFDRKARCLLRSSFDIRQQILGVLI